MNRLKVFGLGIVIGLGAGLLTVNANAKTVEQPKVITYVASPVRVAEQKKLIYEDTKEADMDKAPYSFISLDDDYQIFAEELASECEIDYFTFLSLMFSESSFADNAVSNDGRDVGLMQIRDVNWDTAWEQGFDVHDPFDNIAYGMKMFAELVNKYGYEEAIQCYKCGESGGVKLWDKGWKHPAIEEIMERSQIWKSQQKSLLN